MWKQRKGPHCFSWEGEKQSVGRVRRGVTPDLNLHDYVGVFQGDLVEKGILGQRNNV